MTIVLHNKITAPNGEAQKGYSTYQEPDTKIPSKPKPVFSDISVNGVAIKEVDILTEAQNHTASTPGKALAEAVQALVIRELLWQEAKLKNIKSLPICDENGRQETRKDSAIRILIDKEIKVPKADDAECKKFYDNNLDRCKSATIFEVRHILVAVKNAEKKAWEDALEKANSLISTLSDAPEKFGKLAREISLCPSAKNDGNLGQVSSGTTVAEFEAALIEIPVGTIAVKPVKTRYGYHIIALDRKIEGEILPFETIKDRLQAWLEAKTWSKAVSQYIAILIGKSEITGIQLDRVETPPIH